MSSRSRWKPLALLAAVLVVSAVATCLFVSKANERNVVLGRVDPASGYRCRFTLSSDCQSQDELSPRDPGQLDEKAFSNAPSRPIWQWIAAQMDHSSTYASGSTRHRFGRLWTFKAPYLPGNVRIQEGYPTKIVDTSFHTRVLMQRRLRIDGYSASLITYEETIESLNGRQRYHETELNVYIPDAAILYQVGVGATDPASIAMTDHEMQALIPSFRVEKVTDGKQGIRP